jgi:hypothetical protein
MPAFSAAGASQLLKLSSTTPRRQVRPQASALQHGQVYETKNERRRGQRSVHHDQLHAWRRGHRHGTAIKYLRRTTSAAASNGLITTTKYLVNLTRALVTTGPRPTYTKAGHDFCLALPCTCSVAAFVVNSEPHTGAPSSVRLCVGPELARCVHILQSWSSCLVFHRPHNAGGRSESLLRGAVARLWPSSF